MTDDIPLQDEHPDRAAMVADVLHGLLQPQKWISSMYFYDAHGSALFDRICEQPEYYPTRTEMGILRDNAADIAAALGPGLMLIEPGSGTGEKARVLLGALRDPAAFVPVEISREHLMRSAVSLNEAFPELEVLPVCADFSQPFELPTPTHPVARRAMFFPGSTIGNFEPEDARNLLANFRTVVGDGAEMLVGVDLRKDPAVLERAYDDAAGITAEFNLNVLRRLNRDLGTNFDLDGFRHRAVWNDTESRIEMQLVALRDQSVSLDGHRIDFAAGEYIYTEASYKYSLDRFAALAADAGLRVTRVWTDDAKRFSIQLLEC